MGDTPSHNFSASDPSSSWNKNIQINRTNTMASRTMTIASSSSTSNVLTQANLQKKRFLLFIKILFKSLDQTEESSEVKEIAKNIVADCTRRNRLGDPDYKPLMDAVDRRLRTHVGETHWRRAHLYMQHYMRREAGRERLPKPQRVAMV
jgi:hypothetical protein